MAENVPFALRTMSGIYLAIGLLGIALMSPPSSGKDLLAKEDEVSKEDEHNQSQITSSQSEHPLLQNQKEEKEKVSAVVRHIISSNWEMK